MPDAIFDNTALDYATIRSWFTDSPGSNFLRFDLSSADAAKFGQRLGLSLRRCYLTDARLSTLIQSGENTPSEVIEACLPDAGSTMAGDFGEVLSYIFHLCESPNAGLLGPKKWRLKQDRTKPSPKSDVVHFLLPDWPAAGASDSIICSEVKVKATNGNSKPISSALADSQKDRTSRLASTLVWLRERTILGDETDVTKEQLNRFIDAIDYPVYQQSFFAIAVICGDLVDDEIVDDPPAAVAGHQIAIIAVPSLRDVYTNAFAEAKKAFLPTGVST